MRQHIKKSTLLLLIASILLAGCAGFRARENLRQGVLVLELSQRDFLDVWGNPTHTSAISGDEVVKSGIAGWGGFFFKGRQMYEMWEYDERQTKLVFYSQQLVAWKTSLTVQKLAVSEPEYSDHAEEPIAMDTVEEQAQTVPALPPVSSEEPAPTTSEVAEPNVNSPAD